MKPNSVLFTMDAKGLFTNILHKEGLKTMHDALSKRTNPKVPTSFLVKLMTILLYNNIFEFHDGYWRQDVGAAMGCKPVPDYANIFMAAFDQIIEELEGAELLLLLLRFLDDYFSILWDPQKNSMLCLQK